MNSLLAVTITQILEDWIARHTAQGNPPSEAEIETKKQWLVWVMDKRNDPIRNIVDNFEQQEKDRE